MPSVAHAVYFYFSLIFLIGRTLAVSLYAASVHDESRRSLTYLRCIPKESWCPEAKRFAEEITSDLVALSGMKFFYLTRKLVLSVSALHESTLLITSLTPYMYSAYRLLAP